MDPTLKRAGRDEAERVVGEDILPSPTGAAQKTAGQDSSGRFWAGAVSVVAGVLATFQIYTGFAGPLPNLMQRAVHVGLALTCVFLMSQLVGRGRPAWLRTFLVVAAVSSVLMATAYVVTNYEEIVSNPRFGFGNVPVALGVLLILLLLLASYRTVGLVVPVLALLGLLYPFVSEMLPGWLTAPAFRLDTVIRHLYLTAAGIWGPITGVSAREIASFIILGSFLMATGAGAFFLGLARFLGGRLRGGSAQVALIASTFFGMINGSATANATSTGTMTIPLMKRQGYPAPFAAAVEAVASTGGQITPPVMGATAFVMAELTGVSYSTIAVAAIIPALAFLICVAAGIYFHARRFDLRPSVGPTDEGVFKFLSPRNVMEFVIPVVVLVYLLFVAGRSPALAATSALFSLLAIDLALTLLRRRSLRQWVSHMLKTLASAGQAVAAIGVLVATVQIVASLLTFSGLATRISSELVGIGAGAFFMTLLISMVVCTVLGMELPAVGAYVLGAAVVAPALVALDVPVIAAHMFVLFFSILAAITPPVCTTVFVTASMASAPWLKAAGYAVVLGMAAWLIPFVIVYEPGILMGTNLPIAWLAIASLVLGIVLVAAGGAGWYVRRIRWPIRAVLLALGLIAVAPISWVSVVSLAGGVLLALVLALRPALSGSPPPAVEENSVVNPSSGTERFTDEVT